MGSINNIPLPSTNPTQQFVPYNQYGGFYDSGFEVVPPMTGLEGIGGLKTRMGLFILPPSSLSDYPQYGFSMASNFIMGSYVYLGDYANSSNSTYLKIEQYPNNSLQQVIISDNFNGNSYLQMTPNSTIYGIGNNVNSINTLNTGFIIDGSNGIGAGYLGYGFGIDFSTITREVRIGNMTDNEFIGVDTQTPSMIVSSSLIQNPPARDIVNFITVRDEVNNFYYIPLYQ